MNKNIVIHKVPPHTEEWFKFRAEMGIGASEAGSVMGLVNKGRSSMEVFYEKVGLKPHADFDNEAMFHGRHLEDYVADKWQYYDGDGENYIFNYENDDIKRKCRRVNGIMTNPKYPWLFFSPDRVMNKGSFNLATGEAMDFEAYLEIKTMLTFVARTWEDGIPPMYLVQVHIGMMVMEVDYAEICVLRDGRHLDVHPIPRSEALCEGIVEHTKSFWYDRVLPAKKALEEKKKFMEVNDIDGASIEQQKIDNFAPEPDESDAYRDFLSSNVVTEDEEMPGDSEDFQRMREIKYFTTAKKVIDGMINFNKSCLQKTMGENKVRKMTFGDQGHVNYKTRSGSDKHVLNVYPKEKFDKDVIAEQLSELKI